MNNCDETRQQMSACLDGELTPPPQLAAFTSHLQSCDACRIEFEELQQVDQLLKKRLPIPDMDGNIEQLEKRLEHSTESLVTTRADVAKAAPTVPQPIHNRRLIPRILALSTLSLVFAGVMFWNPFAGPIEPKRPKDKLVTVTSAGSIVRATGPIELLIPDADEWEQIYVSNRIPLRDGCRVRTPTDSLCEIETVETGRIRMNQLAEVYVRDASYVELVKGQIWCESPASPALQIAAPVSNQITVFCCPDSKDSSQFQCQIKDNETSVASYTVNTGYWSSDTIDQNVQPWETLSFDADSASKRTRSDEGERVWQLPLLAVHGVPQIQSTAHNDQELDSLLSPVLATIGRTKVMHMNESRIRQLGPAGAIPLLMFVAKNSPKDINHNNDRETQNLRRTAMRIAADTADASATSLLQQLSRDRNTEIANLASRALQRIRAA